MWSPSLKRFFHPMGLWHSAWTQRSEPLSRLAIRIIRGYGAVEVERKELPAAAGITPNYVLRSLSTMPRLQGTSDLPSLDNLLAHRWATRAGVFR